MMGGRTELLRTMAASAGIGRQSSKFAVLDRSGALIRMALRTMNGRWRSEGNPRAINGYI